MDFKKLLNDVKPHAFVILAFFLIGYVYFLKTFQGYTNREEDVTQGLLKSTEIMKYKAIDNATPGWTNSIFGGMPTTMIYGKENYNYVPRYSYLTPLFNGTAYPFKILFLSFIGFYLLMCAFKVKPLFGALAAIAYGFATYSIISIEAAHYTKVQAMALMPAILAGMHWLYRGKYFLGGIMLAYNLALQLYYFHYQITFYSLICMVIMGIYYIIVAVQDKKIKQALIASLIAVIAVTVGVLTSTSKIKTTSKFAESTMRGVNDMSKTNTGKKQKETGKNGLDRDYAFEYSYGVGETFTLLIPRFYGGSQAEKLSTSSEFYKNTQNDEAIAQGLPMYHGGLSIQSGTTYIGSIIIFLFVLGLVVIKSRIKWALLALTLVSFALGWGKHFSILNNFLFDHLPYFNKFRTPMMAFCIAQVSIPLLGFLGLKQLYENWQTAKIQVKKNTANEIIATTSNTKEIWQKITYVFYGVGGFCLLMALFGPAIIDMGGPIDKDLAEGGNTAIIPWLKEDRASLLRGDAFRSFIFIGLAFVLLWAWYTNKIQKNIAIAIIGGLAAIDLIGVDWRYLSWSDFTFEKGAALAREKDEVDNQILVDKDLHYITFDLSNNPFNSNEGAAFHKMIGGYDPAKLSRYQDLISELLSNQQYQNAALDMLNCKYVIGTDSMKRRGLIPRPSANGNAWFVQKLTPKDDAVKEMEALKAINNKKEAVFNITVKNNKGLQEATFQLDSTASAKLTSYHPDTLKYNVSNTQVGYLVFSEIFYEDWKVEIDGKEATLNKVDYTLRGVNMPAGNHQVKLYFKKLDSSTDTVDFISSLVILGLVLISILLWLKTYTGKSAND